MAHRTYSMRRATVPEVKIAAEVREEFGKGPARRARRKGHVPAVLYGHGTDTRHLMLPGHDVMLALKTPNVLIRLEGLPSGSALVLPKAVQRNAVKGDIEHVDLILVRQGEKVTVEVPITLTGEIQSGGVLDQQLVQVTVEAEATHIPQSIEVDVEGMEIGTAVHAGDLTLPRGVSLQLEPDTLILHVLAPAAAEEPAGTEAETPEAPPAPVAEAASGAGE
jgi:large subunit ribosomal protein L25